MPGVIFVLNPSLKVFAYTEFKRMDTKLYAVPLPNINSGGWVCLGSAYNIAKKNINMEFGLHINFLETVFWESTFTHDGSNCIQKRNYNSLMAELRNSELEFPTKHLVPINQKLRDVLKDS
jgi:hypothetical protein